MKCVVEKSVDGKNLVYSVSDGRMKFVATDLGCTILSIFVPDRSGNMVDVALGFGTVGEYDGCGDSRGAVVGRVANRISGAGFTLDGKRYELDANDGANTLHGGTFRYEKALWSSGATDDGVIFRRRSADGEQGFPGNVDITVEYALRDGGLFMGYTATCDARTPISLTNHSYFNLNGTKPEGGKIEGILNHELQIDSGEFLEVDGACIPTGRILPVAGTPLDFRSAKSVGKDIAGCDMRIGGGYDNCYITGADETGMVRFGMVSSPLTGISMEIFTNQRGVQVYSGNYLEGSRGRDGMTHSKHDGICFESQRLNDAVNRPEFPGCIMNPGEVYRSETLYKFL